MAQTNGVREFRRNSRREPFVLLLVVLVAIAGLGSGCSGLVGSNQPPGGGPSPTGVTVSNAKTTSVTTSSAAVSWDTNVPATSQIEFGTSTSYGLSTSVDPTLVTSHQQGITNLASGTLYHFRVRSRDANNNEALSGDMTLTTSSVPDTTAPTVSISSPAANSTVSGTITVTATASDNVGVVGVQFKVNGNNIGAEDTTSTYSASLNTTTLANGNHSLTAVARDAAGNTATSPAVTVNVNNGAPDTTLPTVSITAPAGGATVSGTVTVSANASDNVGVMGVQFRVDGSNVGAEDTSAPYSISWATTGVLNGSHSITAVARDAAGNTRASAGVSVTVSNVAPPPPPTGSSLSALAASMQPGTFAQLTGMSGWNNGDILTSNPPSTPSDYITQYADSAGWDPLSRQVFFEGMSHTNPNWKRVIYRESDNSWRVEQSHADLEGTTVAHAYDHNTVDTSRGDSYHRLYFTRNVYKRSSAGANGVLPAVPASSQQVAGGLEYFPELDSLILVDSTMGVWRYQLPSGPWSQMMNAPQIGPYHNFIEYHPIQRVVIFGGGNGSRSVYKINAAGAITKMANAPFDVGITFSLISSDPTGGNYLVMNSVGQLYEYNVVADTWSNTGRTAPFDPVDGTIEAAITTHGVIIYVSYNAGNSRVYLYKHSTGGAPPPPPPPPPGDTTSPSVAVSSPASGATVSGNMTVTATASDNVGVAGVQFLLDGANLGAEDTSTPYSTAWDTTTASNGTHVLTAQARDAAGNTATSAPISVSVSNAPPPPPPPGGSDFQTRCSTPGVIMCVGFDVPSDIAGDWGNSHGILLGRIGPNLDGSLRASGASSLKFTIPSNSGPGSSGSYFTNFADDLSTLFGEGEEFYIQWRQRFSPEFLNTFYTGGGGQKQIIIGEGDRAGVCNPANPTSATCPTSCTQLEVVVQNTNQRGGPQMYHSCGGKDGKYQALEYWDSTLGNVVLQNAVGCLYPSFASPPCVKYKADQWLTFQVRVKIGTWYKNDGVYHYDSSIQMWMAEEGQPSVLVIDFTPQHPGGLGEHGPGYDIANNNPLAAYGKLWLLPYHTGKSDLQAHPEAYTWYDELIISLTRIADPR